LKRLTTFMLRAHFEMRSRFGLFGLAR
jgi:hypothetical protein